MNRNTESAERKETGQTGNAPTVHPKRNALYLTFKATDPGFQCRLERLADEYNVNIGFVFSLWLDYTKRDESCSLSEFERLYQDELSRN